MLGVEQAVAGSSGEIYVISIVEAQVAYLLKGNLPRSVHWTPENMSEGVKPEACAALLQQLQLKEKC